MARVAARGSDRAAEGTPDRARRVVRGAPARARAGARGERCRLLEGIDALRDAHGRSVARAGDHVRGCVQGDAAASEAPAAWARRTEERSAAADGSGFRELTGAADEHGPGGELRPRCDARTRPERRA